MFARSSGYAVQALTYLAGQPSGKLVGAREIATTQHIPMPFLWKILRKLGHQKLVRSFKGVHGGYELARPAETIYVSEILRLDRDEDDVSLCLLGLQQCNDDNPCPLHEQWKEHRAQIEATLLTTTLADLAKKGNAGRRKRSERRRVATKLAAVS